MRPISVAAVAVISLLLGVSIGFAAKYKGAGIEVIRGKSDKDAGYAALTEAEHLANGGAWELIAVGRAYYLTGEKARGQALFDVVANGKAGGSDLERIADVYAEAGENDKAHHPRLGQREEIAPVGGERYGGSGCAIHDSQRPIGAPAGGGLAAPVAVWPGAAVRERPAGQTRRPRGVEPAAGPQAAAGGRLLEQPHPRSAIDPGADHRRLLPASALLGAIYLLAVDDVARSLSAQEIPLGVLTALLGTPIFAVVFWRSQSAGWVRE